MEIEQRVIACFQALATGDAIGKQTETLPHSQVQTWYPGGISGFHGVPGDVIPRYKGKLYPWRIGETTDDTEQTLAVARAILRERDVRHGSIGKELLQCRKSIHPGVSMWPFLQAGDPSRIALDGDGCGAAMRVSPVGVVYPSSQLDRIVEGAHQCAIPTHGGQTAICAATAVAIAVSMALDGFSSFDILTAVPSIERIHADLLTRPLSADSIAERHFPNTPQTIVPLAISLALITESAEETILLAANIGGDSDSVASIGGAIAGALRPETVNERWFDVVSAINEDDIVSVALSLASVRGKMNQGRFQALPN